MSWLLDNLRHSVTHWAKDYDASGNVTFSAPVVLAGRWREDSKLFRSADGREAVSRAIVTVESDVSEGDFLFFGESVVADPRDVPGAGEVMRFTKVPDLHCNDFLRRAFL